jgi:two-component system response regulator YesN
LRGEDFLVDVLIVDDQRAIVESLKREIHWETIPVDKVYAACSAKEAKMVLNNFSIDVLLTDIEMPEEDGLSLFRWVREKFPAIEGIFLTSHADFKYAQEAIHMGGCDYILQPARCEEVENILRKARDKVKSKQTYGQLEDTKRIIQEQRNNSLDGLLRKISLGEEDAADNLYLNFSDIFRLGFREPIIYPVLVEILRWKKAEDAWEDNMVRLVFCNVMEELFESAGGKVTVSSFYENRFWIMLVLEKAQASDGYCRLKLEEFIRFVDANMEFQVGIYPAGQMASQSLSRIVKQLSKRADENSSRKKGIFWRDAENSEQINHEDAIKLAKVFIAKNLSANISRAMVAKTVFLNEEYFSRLFRQQTGYTFKEYLLNEKMNLAKKLLAESHLSISIIASKVGYDNFSHFSQMFKKMTDKTPQEYRREHGA